jgi:N-methylhydantoinase A
MGFSLVDVGGTFTDAALLKEDTGELKIAKTPTAYDDSCRGVLKSSKSPVSRTWLTRF